MFEDFKGIGGFLLDVYRLGRLKFVNGHSFTKFLLILEAKRITMSRIFIEIGTYRGVTATRCSRHFEKVYTVEIEPELAKKALMKFSRIGRKNIELIKGDGLRVLSEILSRSDVKGALVYLDGHPCGSITGSGAINEPAVEELSILARYRDKVNAIIVDDFRHFGVESDFPAKSMLLRQAEELFAPHGYSVSVAMDQLRIFKTKKE